MPRTSAFKGTWEENRRPYITLAPDAYIAIQGQTSVVTCGECNRKIDINKYLTGFSTEASVDSPPGSATINLSVPDTDINELYMDGNFVVIPMMEVEIFSKGYYTVGGLPQYYRCFWGVIVSITKSWSNGVTTFSLSCKDILYWWEKTNVILNQAFLGNNGETCGYNLFGNRFAGSNPYTIIIQLAREAMGDFSITDGSFMSFKPEAGIEKQIIGNYGLDIMGYWQLKFGNIWNALVLYGTSGTAYTFEGDGTSSPLQLANTIFKAEQDALNENDPTSAFKVQPHEVAAFKVELQRAGDVQFFQNETQSKLSIALAARDQIAYEFYCDTTGDIIFKPPFYNINTIPNKPVSWINDFEIIDDSITESEQEVVTHMTSSGNAFGGVMDYGLTDEITIPRTGVIDWHLLKRYGWRRQDFQCEWAGNPHKLFWFLIDYMDRLNAKRHNGTVTIPIRPELRMGFPVWVPHYDSFYYVNGISHNYSVGGQATTTLTLVAKRSKFIAPSNIGKVERVPGLSKTATKTEFGVTRTRTQHTYKVSFDEGPGQTAGLGGENQQENNKPLIIRDPNTGKLLGYPNVVMVYRTTFDAQALVKQASKKGELGAHKPGTNQKAPQKLVPTNTVNRVFQMLHDNQRAALLKRIRNNRYEVGFTNAGLYDYAVDVNGDFKEMVLVPVTSVLWGTGTGDPTNISGSISNNPQSKSAPTNKKGAPTDPREQDPHGGKSSEQYNKDRGDIFDREIANLRSTLGDPKKGTGLLADQKKVGKQLIDAKADFNKTVSKNHKGKKDLKPTEYLPEELTKQSTVTELEGKYSALSQEIKKVQAQITTLNSKRKQLRLGNNINVSIRPVSDEFGFEVIGHNRYGRGVFVDRGHIKLQNQGPSVNELRIQFSPVGGTLTTNLPTVSNVNLQSQTFSDAFERMQPEDWVTGASNYNDKTQVVLTSANTYSSAINHAIGAKTTSYGGAVFAEVDALRRSKTLWELEPTMKSGVDEVGYPKCGCNLGRFQWFSVLPKQVVQEILSPTVETTYTSGDGAYLLKEFLYVDAFTGADTFVSFSERTRQSTSPSNKKTPVTEKRQNQLVAVYEGKNSTGVIETIRRNVPGNNEANAPRQIDTHTVSVMKGEQPGITGNDASQIGLTSFPDFFERLNKYLIDKFSDAFASNQDRETKAVGEYLGVEVAAPEPGDYVNPESILGPGGGSLMDRASHGDVEALNQLQNQANWNWGATQQALKQFNQAVKNVEQPEVFAANTPIWNPLTGGVTEISDSKPVPSNRPQVQPITPAKVELQTDPDIVASAPKPSEFVPPGRP